MEGFHVLRGQWRAVVGWAGFQIVTFLALCLVLFVLLLAVVPFAGSRDVAGAIGATIGGVLLGAGSGLIELVLLCGLFRLLLRPAEPGFMHLRIGRDEARVFGAILLLALIAVALLIAGVAAVTVLGRISTLLAVVGGLAILVGCYAFLLRLGLTPTIAFAERRIAPLESWRRTRGQTWPLFGMALLLLCLIGLVAVLVAVVMFVVGGLLTGFDLNFGDEAETFAVHPLRFALQIGVELVLTPVFLVIGQAPWVAAYQALTPAPSEP